LKVRIQKILAAGANVILTKMGLDDIANKYLLEAGCIGIRRVEKGDLHRISTMATPEG
jgi:T-complex protein 1 subunit alpha